MAPDPFPHIAPEATDFAPLISQVSRLLGLDLKAQIQNDLKPLRSTSVHKPAEEERVVSAHDALIAAVDELEKAKKDLDALKSYVVAAEEYAREHLNLHSTLKAYLERTNDQPALQSESVAPIQQLPNEVLQLIFLEVHAQSTETERYNPITAQVCTFWRQLAEATPFLWTTINVNLLPGREDDMEAVVQMEVRLQRARQRYVSLHLSPEDDERIKFRYLLEPPYSDLVDSDSDVDVDPNSRPQDPVPPVPTAAQCEYLFNAVITSLSQYADRIISLQIKHHYDSLGGHLAKRCATEGITFKHLRTLSVYAGRHGPRNFDTEALLKACPNIDHLRMYEVPDTPYIRWEKMKEFKGRLDNAALSAFVSRAQDIEQAEIWSYSWSRIPTIAFSNRLTSLSLDNLSIIDARHLAAAPCPSNLRYLSLWGNSGSASILLDSWGWALEFLALELYITAKDLKDLLPATPNLQGLRLYGDRPAPPNLFNLLPKLTHLELRATPEEDSEPRVRRVLAGPLKRTSRRKRLLLRSVTFLPHNVCLYYNSLERWAEHEGVWTNVHQDLKAVGIDVHEYRGIKAVDGRTFNTPFFKERE